MGPARPTSAQLDYDTYDIWQNGAIAGTIYVPQRGVETGVYSEYWVLVPNYIYPARNSR